MKLNAPFRSLVLPATAALLVAPAPLALAGLAGLGPPIMGENGLFAFAEGFLDGGGFDVSGPPASGTAEGFPISLEVNYRVDVLDPSAEFHAFGFSFSDGPEGILDLGDLGAELLGFGWTGEYVSAPDWDTFSATVAGTPVTGASLGAFDDLFGPVDSAVAFFYGDGTTALSELTDADMIDWTPFSSHFVRLGGLPATEAIGLDISGSIIDASLPSALTAVPEASESALILLGASGLLAYRRRRRRA